MSVITSYDPIVVGLGGMGSAAAHHLAARGGRVLGLDGFGPPHDRGSSHGETRVVRQAYFEHPGFPALDGRTRHDISLFALDRFAAG